MNERDLILGLLSLLVLSPMCIYAYLLTKEDNTFLYNFSHWAAHNLWQKSFFVLTIIGLITLLYTGVNSMLGWMPDTWGYIDKEDSEFVLIRDTLTAFITFPLLIVIIQKAHALVLNRVYMKCYRIESQGLQDIINQRTNAEYLRSLKKNYEVEIKNLENILEEKERWQKRSFSNNYWHPESGYIASYNLLINNTDKFINAINNEFDGKNCL